MRAVAAQAGKIAVGWAAAVTGAVLATQLITGAAGSGLAGLVRALAGALQADLGESAVTGEAAGAALIAPAIATAELVLAAVAAAVLAGWPLARVLASRGISVQARPIAIAAGIVPLAFLLLPFAPGFGVAAAPVPGVLAALGEGVSLPTALAPSLAAFATVAAFAAWRMAAAGSAALRGAAALPHVEAQRRVGAPEAALGDSMRHAAALALLPQAGLAATAVLGWTFVAEAVLQRDGLGSTLVAAAAAQDAPMMAGAALVYAAAIASIAALARLVSLLADPRARRL